jgi:fibronectin type 3 domain-containing protein
MSSFRRPLVALLALAAAPAVLAIEPPPPGSLAEKTIRPAWVAERTVAAAEGDPAAPAAAPGADAAGTPLAPFRAFAATAGGSWSGRLVAATGRAASLAGSGLPLVPGAGNARTDGDPRDLALLEQRVRALIAAHPGLLAPGFGELVLSPQRSVVIEDGRVAFVDFDWTIGGIPVEGAGVYVHLNSGNVIQLGTRLLSGAADPAVPALDEAAARRALREFVRSATAGDGDGELDRPHGEPRLFFLPVEEGDGLRYRLVWEVAFRRIGEQATWTGRVDARDGTVVQFFDANAYGEVTGGVYPRTVTDPEVVVPFPFVQVDGAGVTNAAGRFPFSGVQVSTGLDGRFFATSCEGCSGPAQAYGETALGLGWLKLGAGGADQNANGVSTPAERNSFFHLNEVRLVAKKWLNLPWFEQTLQSNVNIASTCNAYWNGSVNFYRSGGGCNNTGEIADVMQHEWGHGIDQNTLLGDSATGEGTGDHVAFLMTHGSVIGPYFRTSGSGVRDVNRLTSPNGLMTRSNVSSKCPSAGFGCSGPLGRQCHCEGEIYGQTGWDLAQNLVAKHGYHTGWLTYERIFFASLPQAGSYLPNQANAIYDAYLAVDDDDGNLSNGTPNAKQIYDAFNLHEIAGTQRTTTAGCARPAQPVVTVTPGCDGVTLSWPAVSGAAKYRLTRTLFSPDRAFLPLTEVTGTSFVDAEVRPGTTYYYAVQAITSGGCGSTIENVVSTTGPARPIAGIVAVAADDTPRGNRSGTVDPGEAVDLFLTLENASPTAGSGLVGTIASTAPGVTIEVASQPFPDLAGNGTAINAAGFRAAIASSVACGTVLPFTFTVTDASGCTVDTQHFTLRTGGDLLRRADGFTGDSGWAHDAPSSTAATGTWTRGTPDATPWQAGADSDDAGDGCWFTAPNFNGDSGDDVDGGEVVLLSPIFSLAGLSGADLSYQRWWANSAPGADTDDWYWVEASNDGGSSWQTVEKLGSSQAIAAWTRVRVDLDALLPLTATMRLRVRVADGAAVAGTVEGGFDDFRITEPTCDATPPCFVAPSFAGLASAAPGPDCAEAALSWGAAASSCTNATISYSVYRSTDPGFVPSDATRVASGLASPGLVDRFLVPGTGYSYVVRAVDSRSGEDGNLVRRSVTAPASPDTKPPAFSGVDSVVAGAACGETELAWSAAQETCSGPVVYEVHRATTPGFTPSPSTLVGLTTATSLVDSGLAPTTTYYYAVRASDRAGNADGNVKRRSATATVLPELLSSETFESGAAGWARSGLNDAASGLWELGDPTQTDAQPGTCPSGSACWATGLNNASLGDNDIDGGTTTLLSARFSLVGAASPAIRYKRYYSNNTGATPGTDSWKVDLSTDDGASWTPIENTTASDAGLVFTQFEFPLGGIAPTANMRVRFVAADLADGSLVEAVVDDFELVDATGGCDGCPAPPSVGRILAQRDGADVVLDWTGDPVSAGRFKAYSSAQPDFSDGTLLGTTTAKSYRHAGGAAVGAFTAYLVTAVDACGQEGPLR